MPELGKKIWEQTQQERKRQGKEKMERDNPCLRNKCIKCCVETEMQLSPKDVERILDKGFNLKDFASKTKACWQLKNIEGRCVFMKHNLCEIYSIRPEGCRLYPIVYDDDLKRPLIDSLCPHGDKFEIDSTKVARLERLIKKLDEENVNCQ